MDEEQLKIDVANGLSQNQMARKYNRGATTIVYWLKKYGLRSHGKAGQNQSLKYDPKEIQTLLDQGKTYADLYNELGIASVTLVKYSKRGLIKVKASKRRLSDEEVFVNPSYTARSAIKKRFLNKADYQCEICGNQGEHNQQKLKLEMDHIDGNRFNNELANLRLLCPNCHSQQRTSNRQKETQQIKVKEKELLKLADECNSIREIINCLQISESDRMYKKIKGILNKNNHPLYKKCVNSRNGVKFQTGKSRHNTRKVERPPKEELEKLIQNHSFLAMGRMFGVSDNSIRNWCKWYEIDMSLRKIKHGDVC